MANVFHTGLLWFKVPPPKELEAIQKAYTYVHPMDPEVTFWTYVRTQGRIGIPSGNFEKALRFLPKPADIEDMRISPAFSSEARIIGDPLRDYQEQAKRKSLNM